jgi:hypothetical protein
VRDRLLSDPNGEFVLNPFEDIEQGVSASQIKNNPSFGAVTWRGHTDNRERLNFPERTEAERRNLPDEVLRDALTNVTFYAYEWDVQRGKGTAQRSTDRAGGIAPELQRSAPVSNLKRNAFRSVRGQFQVVVPSDQPKVPERKRFRLEPLKYTPKYHIIYEVDESKAFQVIDTPFEQLPSEVQEKVRKHNEYLDSLPKADPSHAIVEEIQ